MFWTNLGQFLLPTKSKNKGRESTMSAVFIILYFVDNYLERPKMTIAAPIILRCMRAN